MKQEAVQFALQAGANRRAIARRYGISRPCLYKWMARFNEQGLAGLANKSRRPLHSPKRSETELEALILELRDQQPCWGGRKLRRRLGDLGPMNCGRWTLKGHCGRSRPVVVIP